MEIIFLGTGGGRIVLSNQKRSTGGFLLRTNDSQIHVDPGSGAILRMKMMGINPRRTNIVCVSHNHTDHAGDIKAVSESINNGVLIAPKKTCKVLLGQRQRGHYKEVHGIAPGDKLGVNGLEITGTRARHNARAVGFIFESGNKRIGYTGDTAYFNGLSHQFESCHALIINVLRPDNYRLRNHLCTEQVINFLNKMEKKPELTILTHFGMKMLNSSPLNQARKISLDAKVACRAAEDNMRLKINSLMA